MKETRKRKLNILIFNRSAAAIGGSEYSTLAIAQQLKRRGHNVIYASDGGDLVGILEQSGIKHYRVPLRRFLPYMLQFSVASIARLVRVVVEEEIDCIHCFQYFSLLASCVAQLVTGVPCVFSAIGPCNYHRFPNFQGQIIAYCGEFREQIANKNPSISAESIYIIPNRIDLQRYRPGIDGSELLSRFNLRKNSPKVVMLSRFFGNKTEAISDLVDATPYVLERVPQTQVIIVGDGPEYGKMEAQVAKLNQRFRKDVIILTGALRSVPQILNTADLVVGVGRSVLEGMACQKPAIVLGERGFAGIVQPETVDEIGYFNFAGRNVSTRVQPSKLADAIVSILKDPEYASSLGEFCREFAAEEFDAEVGGKRLEKVYREVISSNDNSMRARLKLLISLNQPLSSRLLEGLHKGWSNLRNGQTKRTLSALYSK